MRSVTYHLVLASALAALPTIAIAGDSKAPKDPNRIVCEKQEVLGSRLTTRRVCMTAAEWAAKRANERQVIDRTQTLQQGPTGG